MNKEDKGIMRHIVVNIIILLLMTFLILILSRQENYARQLVQIKEYTNELSARTGKHVEDVFTDKRNAIEAIAYLYGEAMGDLTYNRTYLRRLEESSGFDRIRFIDLNGDSYTSDGKIAEVSDRDYYQEGIKGNSGSTVVLLSRVNSERLIGFYAPIYHDNELCGVMAGFLNEDTVSDILKTNLYGYPAETMIVSKEGRILGRYKDGQTTYIEQMDELHSHVNEREWQSVSEALAAQQQYSFEYRSGSDKTVCYLLPIEGTEWMLYQKFPPEAAKEIAESVTNDERFAMFLFAIVILWFGVQMLYTIKKKIDLDHKKQAGNKITTLLKSVSDDYICLIDVNLKTEMEEQFRMYDGTYLEDWAKGNFDYNHCIESYANDFVTENDRPRFLAATRLSQLKKVLAAQKTFYIEYDAILAGEERRLQSRFTISRDNPQEEHMLAGIRDITEDVREKRKQQTSMNLILSAASTVYPFILEVNLSKDIARTVYNRGIVNYGKMEDMSMEDLLEDLKKTILNKDDYENVLATMQRAAQIEAYKQGKRDLHIQVRQLADDGEMHWMEIRNILMMGQDEDLYSISMVRCVDEDLKLTEELREAKDAAESANRAKSTFLFNMSHDIRTPMNAIMGFSEMAEKYSADPEKVRDCLEKIHVSGEHLLKLINNVLDMARIESGKMTLNVQAHHIPTSMKKVEYIFHADVERKKQNLRVEWDIQDEIAFFDMLYMNQIELNLISNAIKYTPEGGEIIYSVKQTGRENGKAVYRCSVRDNGIGMSKEFCQRVFDAFERENSSMTNGIEGSGLGLSITRRLVEEMGGSITCSSEPEKGSEFVCTFHFLIGSKKDLPEYNGGEEKFPDTAGMRVLLVEDNLLNREISHDILKNEGFIVEEAEDGDIAVEKIKQAPKGYYRVILMDIQMPRMNGYEATRKIRALPAEYDCDIPIIAVTANAFEEDRQNAMDAGMNGHIAKPIRLKELRQQLAHCLQDVKHNS